MLRPWYEIVWRLLWVIPLHVGVGITCLSFLAMGEKDFAEEVWSNYSMFSK